MRFVREPGDRRYKVSSKDGIGLVLQVPRYARTDTWVGYKDEARLKGLRPRGSDRFYTLPEGTVVIDGYIAVPSDSNVVELRVKGELAINQRNWPELRDEIESLLNFTEND